MGARKGQPHAPAGTGSVGRHLDKRTGKWVWRGRVTRDGRTHHARAVTQQPGMSDAACRRLARHALNALIRDLDDGKAQDRQKQRARLGEWLTLWLEEQRGALPTYTTTYQNYASDIERHVRPFLGHHRLSGVTAAVVLAWRQALADPAAQARQGVPKEHRGVRSATVVKLASALLRRILRDARAAGYTVQDDVLVLKHPKGEERQERPFLTEAQADLLCAAAPAPRHVLWRVAYYGGLRAMELAGLKWRNVLWTKGAIDVQTQRDRHGNDRAPKKGSKGEVYLPDFAVAELRDHERWNREQGFPTDLDAYVFLRVGGGKDKGKVLPYYYQLLWEMLKRDAKAAKLDPAAALHSLRHGLGMTTAAVATAHTVMGQLRHRLLATTSVYVAHRDPESQRRAAAALNRE